MLFNMIFSRRYTPITMVVLVGVLLAIFVFIIMLNIENRQAENNFERVAFDRISSLESRVDTDIEALRSVVSFYESSEFVNRDMFRKFVAPTLSRTNIFQALEWIPRIPLAERKEYELAARNEGYTGFQITERTPQGRIVPAELRDEYFPVYFIEPYEGNEAALGFDLGSNPVRAAALEKARDNAEMIFSGRITLVQQAEKQHGVLVFAPIYSSDSVHDTIEQRRQNLLGFALGVLRIKDLAETLYATEQETFYQLSGIDFYLYDKSADEADSLLYVHSSLSRINDKAPSLDLVSATTGPHLAHELELGGRTWLAVARPVSAEFGGGIPWSSWISLLVILSFTGLLSSYLFTSLKRKEYVEKLVVERTESLHRSEIRYQSIVDNVLDGLITIDTLGTVQSFNPAAEHIFGYSANEVIGNNVKMLMPAPYQREHDGYLYNYLSTDVNKIIGIGREVKGLRKDGSIFPLDLAVSELNLDDRRVFIGITRDISERKNVEDALQDNAARLTAIFDTVADAIITLDSKGNIESSNMAGAKLFDYDPDELVGKNFGILLSEAQRSKYLKLLEEYTLTGKPTILGQRVESEGRRYNGELMPIEFAVNEMSIRGKAYFTAVIRDISDRKKVERMQNEFISTVSHELRTPLTSIRGALSVVLGKGADGLPSKVRRMLETANRNSERLTYLINDILDLEKIEAGQLDFEFEVLNIISLTRQAIEENEAYARTRNVQLKFEDTTGCEAIVRGDKRRLLQVYANLISNAVKFSPENTTVEVKVAGSNGLVRVSVCDHGHGIPEAFRKRIFERFAQADSSDSREKGGTGLGLMISRAIIEKHEGYIGFNSQQAMGTEFYFDLPMWHEITESINHDPAIHKVLVCEDNADVAYVLASLLEQEGFTSDIASTGNSAKTLLATNDYRLMLLDLTLPDYDGLQLLRELREDRAIKKLPVIVVSGRADEGRKEFNGDAVTVVDWLQKPIDKDRLSNALQQALHDNGRSRVLHVEDELDVIQVAQALLEGVADVEYARSLGEARQLFRHNNYDLVLLDITLPDGSGLELLDELSGCCPVVIFSGKEPSREVCDKVEAALTKSVTSGDELISAIKNVLNQN